MLLKFLLLASTVWWMKFSPCRGADPKPTISGWTTYTFRRDPDLPLIRFRPTHNVHEELVKDDLLRVAYKNSILENGFAFIDIKTNAQHNNTMQAYAAGYAEGVLTRPLIKHKIANSDSSHCPRVDPINCRYAYEFFRRNIQYMKDMIAAHPTSHYWEQVRLVLLQLQGLEDGFHERERINFKLRLDPYGLMALSSDHELAEILFAVARPSPRGSSYDEQRSSRGGGEQSTPLECSALVKLLPDNSDLLLGHATWRPYSTMLKIVKKYHFHFRRADGREFPGNKVAYTSEPGYLFSSNDWYVIASGLVTMETTIGNRNHARAREFVSSEGRVLEWIRNLVANRLATDGKHWCEIFKEHNSGTYNNQWMIVDYNKFKPGVRPSPGAGVLHVLEQIPGLIHARDMSGHLAGKSYWASYNYPYFSNIQLNGGFLNANGESEYSRLPRALIFARDQSHVTDIESMFHLMRKNDYKHDPFSEGDPSKAIASRYDLAGIFSALFGATDAKVTSFKLHKSLQMIAECGPTHDQQRPFRWSDHLGMGVPHQGMPDLFDFRPIQVVWPDL